jgi:drug/metabolite transporter (DMT)-like permease
MTDLISKNFKSTICFILISIIWGSTWSINKLGIEDIPVEVLAYLRNLIAGIIMVSFFLFKGYGFPSVKQLVKFSFLSLLLFSLNNLLLLYSLAYIPAHTAAVIGCLSPIFIHVIYQTKNKLKINPTFIIGCILCVIGIWILLSGDLANQSNPSYLWGIMLSIVAVLAWSIGFFIMEKNKQDENIYYSFAWQLLLSAITLFTFSLFRNYDYSILTLTVNNWLIVFYLAIFGSVIAFICLAYTIKNLHPNISSLYVFTNPIVAFIVSIIFFSISLKIEMAIGLAIILIGLWVSTVYENKIGRKKSVFNAYTGNKNSIVK